MPNHFYRLKKSIQQSRFDRLNLIAKTQFVDQHLERIDQLELINSEYWKLYRETKDTFKKALILEKIAELQTYISPYYDASMYVMQKQVQSNHETEKDNPIPLFDTDSPLSEHANELDIFLGKPFWIEDKEKHDLEFLIEKGNCCFNHIIGLPVKNGIEHPIYDYELDVVDKIENHRNIWIKKASGIGATELILRYLTWKTLVNNDLEYKNIFIVSGTFFHHANELKVRMQNLFRNKFPLLQLESKFTDLWIKNTNVKIFPSRNVKDLRGYTDVSYLFIDEADHFEPSVNSELLHAITRYEEKSNCTTIMVSTPNDPTDYFKA